MEKNEIMYLVTQEEGKLENGIRRKGECHRTEVFCGEKSAGRQEFYGAARNGMNAGLILVVDRDDFAEAVLERNGRKYRPERAEYDGDTYRIIRTYIVPGSSDMELTCEAVENGAG